ncbi:unnamed protein product [Symbiodinium sp. KB8]|nr:unnamed protein product [Symbiodinium sp. KB8]
MWLWRQSAESGNGGGESEEEPTDEEEPQRPEHGDVSSEVRGSPGSQQAWQAMELHMQAQEKKLCSASRALKRARSQVQQLTAQLSLKDIERARLETQVAQFRTLLVEKERRLHGALDALDAAGGGASALGGGSPLPLPEDCRTARKVPAPSQTEDDGQFSVPYALVEQLTAALQHAQRQSAAQAMELTRERRQREQLETELSKKVEMARHCKDIEKGEGGSASSQTPPSTNVEATEGEGSRKEAVEEGDADNADRDRRSVEDHLRQALAWKRIGRPFHPHLEV